MDMGGRYDYECDLSWNSRSGTGEVTQTLYSSASTLLYSAEVRIFLPSACA